jgi:diadenylate cyclase
MLWFRWQTVVDFAALAVALYFLLLWARETRALRVVFTIIGLHASARIARQFDLTITGWILDIVTVLLVVLLLFFFQPEFRQAFMRLDNLLRLGLRRAKALESGYQAVSAAAFRLAAEKIGALIVIARRDSLKELISGGIALGADISPEILTAIFRKDSPIHDGAALVEANRISRAGVVLPLTQRETVPAQYGTRHRAAMGMAERCDALVVVVSEERGEVTLMHDRQIVPARDPAGLFRLLQTLMFRPPAAFPARMRRWLFADLRYKLAAGSLAALLWAMSVLTTGATVRLASVPVEFAGVPPGMEIATKSATRLEVQLRGASWFMSSVGLTGLVARFDLKDAGAGSLTLKIGPDNLNLPPGVTVERVRPETISVRLVRRPDG